MVATVVTQGSNRRAAELMLWRWQPTTAAVEAEQKGGGVGAARVEKRIGGACAAGVEARQRTCYGYYVRC